MTPIQLPELSRQGLQALYQQKQQADLLYSTALNSTLAAHGLDPRLQHSFDLDTGIITPAAQE